MTKDSPAKKNAAIEESESCCLLGWFFSYRTYFGFGLLSGYGLYRDICKKLPEGVGWEFYTFIVLLIILAGLTIINKCLHRQLLPKPSTLWLLTLLGCAYSLCLNEHASMLGSHGSLLDGNNGINIFTILALICFFAASLGRWAWCAWLPILSLSLLDRILHYGSVKPIMISEFLITPFTETLSNLTSWDIFALCITPPLALIAIWLQRPVLKCVKGGRLQLLNLAIIYATLAMGFSALSLNATKKEAAHWPLNEILYFHRVFCEAKNMQTHAVEPLTHLPSPAAEPCSIAALKGGEGVVVIVHIGHGIRADHMSINGYPRATMPWLQQQKNLINFPNCHSSSPDINQALVTILTNARSAADPPTTGSVLDIFRKVGFKLYVRSRTAKADNVTNQLTVRLLSKGATARDDDMRWNFGFHRFDIHSNVDHHHPEQNALIFVCNEPHADAKVMFYNKTYKGTQAPFTPWTGNMGIRPAHTQEMLNAYDNCIFNIDTCLRSIFDEAEEFSSKGRPILYVFIGAYGEYLGQNGIWSMDDKGAETLDYHANPASRVGMFVLANPEFESLHPDFEQALKQLRKNANLPIGHEHMFHTLLGLLNIQSPHRDPELDLTSPRAKGRKNNL